MTFWHQRRARVTAVVLNACVAISTSGAAQDPAPSALGSVYASRMARAYAFLGKDLLIVRSNWAPASLLESGFEQVPNFYYFTGDGHVLGAVLVLDGGARRAELFLPSVLPAGLRWLAPHQPNPTRAVADSFHVDRVSEWSEFAPFVASRLAAEPRLTVRVDDGGFVNDLAGNLGTPLDSLAPIANPYRVWLQALRQRWPDASVRSDNTIETQLRAVKDFTETVTLRRVAAVSVSAFMVGLRRFSPHRRQRDVEAAVVEACVRLGPSGPSFWPWAMTGPSIITWATSAERCPSRAPLLPPSGKSSTSSSPHIGQDSVSCAPGRRRTPCCKRASPRSAAEALRSTHRLPRRPPQSSHAGTGFLTGNCTASA